MLKLLAKVLDRPSSRGPTGGAGKAPGAAKEATGTRLDSSPARVHALLQEIGAKRVLIHGNAAAFAAAQQAFPGIACEWASNELGEIEAGAPHVEDLDFGRFDAAVASGPGLPRRYRQLLRLMAAKDAKRPVFWIGEGFEYCGGTLSAPAGMKEVDGLLFNHFDAFFGVKDQLQFRIEIYHGSEVKRYYRILGPNQSHVVRLSEHFPESRHPVSLAVFVEHPVLTRDRHYRMRLCGDVFWKDSLTTLHSNHEFNRSPDHAVEFRLPAWLVRAGEVALTLPNFDRVTPAGAEVETIVDAKAGKTQRDPKQYLEQSVIRRDEIAEDRFLGWRYQGFGGSNWFALEGGSALADGHEGNIAGNHHVSCKILDRTGFAAGAEELARYQKLERDGFVLEPHPVPLMPEGSELVFGFEADSANPRLRDYRLDYFDAAGAHLGEIRYTKTQAGPLFPQDLAQGLEKDGKERARLALVSNDWQKAKLRFKGFKPMANMIVRNRRTGDQDFTEFQSAWRNLGAAVPGFPHWLTDDLAVIGRTNVFGRVRCDAGLRTGVMIANASGRLSYRTTARANLTVFNSAGMQISAELSVPAFTWRLVWLNDLMPLLSGHLGGGQGALLLRSGDADLNCEIVTTSPAGAVSLQHLWGY